MKSNKEELDQLKRISDIDTDYADNDIDDILVSEIGEKDDVIITTTAQSSSPELMFAAFVSFKGKINKSKLLVPIQDPTITHYTCLYIEKQSDLTNKIIYIDPRGSEDALFSTAKLEEIRQLVSNAGIKGNIEVSRTQIQRYSDTEPNNSCGAYVCYLLIGLTTGYISIDEDRNLKNNSKAIEINSHKRSVKIAMRMRTSHLEIISKKHDKEVVVKQEVETTSVVKQLSKKDSEWKLEIHQLDVGQGDSALVLFKRLNEDTKKHEINKAILIDGGSNYASEYLDSKMGSSYVKTNNELNENKLRFFALKRDKKNLEVDRDNSLTKNDGTPSKKQQALIDTISEKEGEIGVSRIKMRALKIQLLKYRLKTLDAIVVTHDDKDHVGGILKMLSDESIFINDDTKFLIQSGKTAGIDNVYITLRDFVTKDIDNEDEQNRLVRNSIVFAYNNIGQNIWKIFGEDKPVGSPDIEFIASDGSFKGAELDLHVQINRLSIAKMEEDNNGSVVSLISMNEFRYYTAGDFETNRNLIEYLQLKEQISNGAVRYLPIQSFLVPHHGSRENFPGAKTKNPMFINSIGARAALISAGGTTHYNHPHKESTDTLDKSDASFVYMTNEANYETSEKFVVSKPKGAIRVQTYQNIAEAGREKFMVKYNDKKSKTRDYFKDKDYVTLKKEILAIIKPEFKEQLLLDHKVKIPLSKQDLECFLDEGDVNGEEKKLKHLNPKTIKEFMGNYDINGRNQSHVLAISISENIISFEINLSNLSTSKSRTVGRFEDAEIAAELFERVKSFGSKIKRVKGPCVGLYLSEDEFNSFSEGTLQPLVDKREEDNIRTGDLFLELIDPDGNTKIKTNLIVRNYKTVLKKEYHKDARENPVTDILQDDAEVQPFSSKVIARRIEYGEVEDRII